jgi:hypothetical protein
LSEERNWMEMLEMFTDVSEYEAVVFIVEVCRARNWSGRLQGRGGEM